MMPCLRLIQVFPNDWQSYPPVGAFKQRPLLPAANGRTVRSLAYMLSMYKGVKIYFVAPDVVSCPASITLLSMILTPFHPTPADDISSRPQGRKQIFFMLSTGSLAECCELSWHAGQAGRQAGSDVVEREKLEAGAFLYGFFALFAMGSVGVSQTSCCW